MVLHVSQTITRSQWLAPLVVFTAMVTVKCSLGHGLHTDRSAKVNSALHPSGVAKSSTPLAGVRAGMSPLLGVR